MHTCSKYVVDVRHFLCSVQNTDVPLEKKTMYVEKSPMLLLVLDNHMSYEGT